MNLYKVCWEEYVGRSADVEADNEEEAIQKMKEGDFVDGSSDTHGSCSTKKIKISVYQV